MNSHRHRIDESNGDIKERNLDWKRDLDFPLDTLRENSDSKISGGENRGGILFVGKRCYKSSKISTINTINDRKINNATKIRLAFSRPKGKTSHVEYVGSILCKREILSSRSPRVSQTQWIPRKHKSLTTLPSINRPFSTERRSIELT